MRPTYLFTETPNGVIVHIQPPGWIYPMHPGRDVKLSDDQFGRFLKWKTGPGLIQDLLPDLTADDREGLMSGLTDADLAAMSDD